MSHAAWLAQADSDLEAAKVLGRSHHHSQAIWLAAQAVEKAHKAILAALGLRYEDRHYKQFGHRIADILDVLPASLLEPLDSSIATMVARLDTRSSVSRYPMPMEAAAGGPALRPLVAAVDSIRDSAQYLADAETLLGWCRDRIQRALRAVVAMRPPAG